MTLVKICGITRLEDAVLAAELGATYIGMVLWPGSPRATTLQFVREVRRVLPRGSGPVAVFVDPSAFDVTSAYEAGIRLVQIHGTVPDWAEYYEPRMPIIRAIALDQVPAAPDRAEEFVLLDAHDPVKHGGTGTTIDWVRASEIAKTRRVFLAGGLTPENVATAISQVRPYAVDVASGVETSPGVKDPDKLRAFMKAVKETV